MATSVGEIAKIGSCRPRSETVRTRARAGSTGAAPSCCGIRPDLGLASERADYEPLP